MISGSAAAAILSRMTSPKDVIRAEWQTPPAIHNDEGMPDPEVVAKKAKKKKDVFVDPEVVRRRREEKAAAKCKAAQAEEEARLRGEIPPEKLRFRKREFVQLPRKDDATSDTRSKKQTISIMTWNVRALRSHHSSNDRVLTSPIYQVAASTRPGTTDTLSWQ